jgi:hypothetical protein
MSEKLDLSRKSLRKFGWTMGVCLVLLGLALFLKHKPAYRMFWTVAVVFFILGQFLPVVLKPVYRLWMGLAFCLGWFNTRLILILLYYLVVTPIGLCAKLFGKDFLDRKWDKNAQSYWHKREFAAFSKERCERIF